MKPITPITLTNKSHPNFFDNMKFLLMNQKPIIQVSKKYMDVASRERNHRILNIDSVLITPGIYVTEKNQKQKIVFRQTTENDYSAPPRLEDLIPELKECIPSLGLSREEPLSGEFKQVMVLPLPYGGNTVIYQNKFNKRFSWYLSSCFNQVITQTSHHFLVDVEFLRRVIEVPAAQPGWFFRFIRTKHNPVFCFVVQHKTDFRLALVAPLIDFKDVDSL